MGFQTLEILRQGVWASITGGWFYDPHHDLFCNTFHLYLWMFLILIPFLIHLWSTSLWYPWAAYNGLIVLVFSLLKIINLRLHVMFDTSESVEEPTRDKHSQKKENTTNSDVEDIELQVLNGQETRERSGSTPPPPLSSSSLQLELYGETTSSVCRRRETSPVNSGDGIDEHCHVQVDVHRKNNSTSIHPVALSLDLHPDNANRHSVKSPCQYEEPFLADDVYTPGAMTSLKSIESEETENGLGTERAVRDSPRLRPSGGAAPPSGRRFSNISNLAFQLSSTATSAPRLGGVGGSLELGFVLEDGATQLANMNSSRPIGALSSVRRTLSALETSSGLPADPSSTASAPQNVGELNYAVCNPISEQGAELQHNSNDRDISIRSGPDDFEPSTRGEESGMAMAMATTPTERSPLLVTAHTECASAGDHWVNFLTSTPHKATSNSNSGCSSTSASQDALHNHSLSRTRQLFALSVLGGSSASTAVTDPYSCQQTRSRGPQEPDTHTSHSSASSSAADSNESEVVHLLPLPPRLLPLPLVLYSNPGAHSLHATAGSDQGVIPKRRQYSGACQIEEESEEDDKMVPASPSGLQDELSQYTPPKRRKLAARRRRHPAGKFDPESSSAANVGLIAAHGETNDQHGTSGPLVGHPTRSRKQSVNRPRRRRRTNAFHAVAASSAASSVASDSAKKVVPATNQDRRNTFDTGFPFVLPAASLPWFVGSGAGNPQGNAANASSVSSTANTSTVTRTTNLSMGGTSNPAALSGSSVSLSPSLQAAALPDYSPTALFQPGPREGRRVSRSEGVRIRAVREREGERIRERRSRGNSTSSSNPTGADVANMTDYFGSSTLQNLLHSLHTGRSPLQFIGTTSLGSVGSGDRHSHINRHPFVLAPMDSVAEVLGRANSLTSSNNNHNEARLRAGTVGSDEEHLSPPILPSTKTRRYYRFNLLPCRSTAGSIKVRFDRLALLALLDRNVSMWDSTLCVFLALVVSLLTASMFQSGLLQDSYAFLFCFVCAGCQYPLLKSVQPDAASPTHGFNRLVAYSRPVYFIVLVSLVLYIDHAIKNGTVATSTTPALYGIQWGSIGQFAALRSFLLNAVLCFPIIFSLGLLPQISTFVVFLLEQVDVHVFGGTAVTGLGSSIYAVMRSALLIALVYGPAYGGLKEALGSQHILFSAYCGVLVASCYHLSRCSSDPSVLWNWILQGLANAKDNPADIDTNDGTTANEAASKTQTTAHSETNGKKNSDDGEEEDSLPRQMREAVVARLRSDAIVCLLIAVVVFGVHCSTLFTSRQLQPMLSEVLWIGLSILGFLLHYVVPQLRKQLPWLCFSRPLMRSHEHDSFEVHQSARLMWFERVFLWLTALERHVLLPLLFLDVVTHDSPLLVAKFGVPKGVLLSVVCSSKAIRSGLTDPSSQYLIITFAKLLFGKDLATAGYSETFLVDYFVVSLLVAKVGEFLLKLQFIITYIAPWQITWGSAFHAFAQPFSVPHSAMLFVQAFVSSVISAPLSPFLGSAIFFTSYARPIKFWERDYKTRRVDASNTRLASQLEPTRNPGGDDNNLNSIFYEHLTRSLQQSLAGDLMLGRWGGPVGQGDCYVLASENLNCLVHLVELANGLVTFQVRGLEFRGTYCQQREVEAISEGVEEDDSCCCCEPGHFPHMLGFNAAFNQRWLAWQVMATKYVLEGYSISDNNAASMLHVYDLRRILVTYYVKSVIYYTTRSPRLEEWLNNPSIVEALQSVASDRSFADLDPVFNINIDEDYDYHVPGITRSSFCSVYLSWIQYCASRREKQVDSGRDSLLVSLCLALSLLGRRALGSAAHSALSSVEFFLYGLHALFKGDFRITCFRDEWVFSDMELLRRVVAPGVRMSLKLHQDHFACPDEYEDPCVLYESIGNHEEKLVISHEGDPAWRRAVLSGAPSLLALRHVIDDNSSSDEYKIIMLNKRFLSFRVIKLNRECVRGLWAGQQQELVYLRNRNQERGSIQNAKQVLRNIINSSCDQPIGYPIYVSPLMTSFAESHPQIRSTLGGPVNIQSIRRAAVLFFRRLRTRCGERCSSGRSGGAQCPEVEISLENMRSAAGPMGLANATSASTTVTASRGGFSPFTNFAGSSSGLVPLGAYASLSATGGGVASFAFNAPRGSSPRSSLGTQRGSIASTMSGTMRKPSGSTLISLAGMLAERDSAAPAAMSATPTTVLSANMGSGTLNGSVHSVRERRSSRGSEPQERDIRFRRSYVAAESSPTIGASAPKTSRPKSSSSRSGEDERRGVRDRSRRRVDRDRPDRFEPHDGEHPLYETEPFMDGGIRIDQRVQIIDPNQVYDTINLGRRIDVLWPNPAIRSKGGKSYWKNWLPETGMQGQVVHRWVPNHPDSRQRSHVDRVILLIQIDDKYVPIAESAVEIVNDNANEMVANGDKASHNQRE